MALSLATFGGGCFWCVEACFTMLKGVQTVTSGYAGGRIPNPTYKQVCAGDTGHAEVVQVAFDSSVLSYPTLLQAFFQAHDPTTLNYQGADRGTQYRSVIFTHNEEQLAIAEKAKAELNAAHVYPNPVVTEITSLTVFYPAEDYHQNYYANNPAQGYCRAVVRPKVDKFKSVFAALIEQK